jgi:hypothetical protein
MASKRRKRRKEAFKKRGKLKLPLYSKITGHAKEAPTKSPYFSDGTTPDMTPDTPQVVT